MLLICSELEWLDVGSKRQTDCSGDRLPGIVRGIFRVGAGELQCGGSGI